MYSPKNSRVILVNERIESTCVYSAVSNLGQVLSQPFVRSCGWHFFRFFFPAAHFVSRGSLAVVMSVYPHYVTSLLPCNPLCSIILCFQLVYEQ